MSLLGTGARRSVGYVVLVEGAPEIALHHTFGETKLGKRALKSVTEDSTSGRCELEVHAKIDLDWVRSSFAHARLEGAVSSAVSGDSSTLSVAGASPPKPIRPGWG